MANGFSYLDFEGQTGGLEQYGGEYLQGPKRTRNRYAYSTPLQKRLGQEAARPKNPFADFLPFGYDPTNIYGSFGEQFLTDNPQIAYLSSPTAEAFTREGITGKELPFRGGAMRGQTPAKRRFYQQSFQDVYEGYLGKLGEIARAGDMPTMPFTEYLRGDIDPTTGQMIPGSDPLSQRYTQLTPSERSYYGSQRTQAFAPRTRQIYY